MSTWQKRVLGRGATRDFVAGLGEFKLGRIDRKQLGLGALGILAGAYLVKRIVSARANRLDGRVVLITGGSRGLGLLLAREFGQRGCKLAICARDPEELDRARLGLVRRGFEVFAYPCDVAKPEEVDQLIAKVLERYGQIDVLVNNASILQVGPLSSMKVEDFRHAMDVNFWGTLNTSLAALDALKQRPGGRLVNICSIGGKVAVPHLLPYDCAKFAVLGFSEGLRAELSEEGISVTTIVPGLMRTGSYTNATFKGDPVGEFHWFAALANAPSTTLDARDAARMIVRATERRKAEVILGWQARLLAAAKALMPSTIFTVLSVVNRFMPRGRANGGVMGRSVALATNRERWS
jgi:short-subunit dehydrogenase